MVECNETSSPIRILPLKHQQKDSILTKSSRKRSFSARASHNVPSGLSPQRILPSSSSPIRVLPADSSHVAIPQLNLSPVHTNCIDVVESSSGFSSSQPQAVQKHTNQIIVPQSTNQQSSKSLPVDLRHWLSESDLDVMSTTLFPQSKKTSISTQNHSLRISQPSDPISEYSSSPIKQPLQQVQRIVKLKAKESISNNGFMYTPRELREANKVTKKKDELLSEMTINFPKHVIDENFTFDTIKQVFEFSNVETYECSLPIIFWKRRIKAEYDSSHDVFIPCEPKTVVEKTIALYYKAQEFFAKLKDGSIDDEITQSIAVAKKQQDLDYSVIVIIEGYDQYINKLKNNENKRFRDGILLQLKGTEKSKRNKPNDSLVDLSQKQIEDLINKTQIEVGVNIFPIRSNQEVIEWLHSFTYTISFALYDKWERNQSLANLGRVKSGTDSKSTFINSFCQFRLMTEPKAERLYGFHSTMYSIYNKLKQDGSLGSDEYNRGLVPPSTGVAIRRAFLSDNPDEVVNS